MLTVKKSLYQRQCRAKQYINLALIAKQPGLIFTSPQSPSRCHFQIINKLIMQYFLKHLPTNNKIIVLNFSSCDLTDEMMCMLAKGSFKLLSELHLYRNQLTGRSLLHLKNGKWKQLKYLDLGQNPLKQHINDRQFNNSLPSTIEIIALQKLNLGRNFFVNLRLKQWKNLKRCFIRQNNICNHALQQIVSCDWPLLQIIDLQQNLITNDGMKTIRKGLWPNLEYIYLKNNFIDDGGCQHIYHTVWNNLKAINLSNSYYLKNGSHIDIEMQVCMSMGKWLSKLKQKEISVYLFYATRYSLEQNPIQNMLQTKGIKFV